MRRKLDLVIYSLIFLLVISSFNTLYLNENFYSRTVNEKSSFKAIQNEKIPLVTSNNRPQKVHSNSYEPHKVTTFIGSGDIELLSIETNSSKIMKGNNAYFSLLFIPQKSVENILFEFTFESIPSQYGPIYKQLEGDALKLCASMTFEGSFSAFSEINKNFSLGPKKEEYFDNYVSVPLNRGSWQLINITCQAESMENCNFQVGSPFIVDVLLNPHEHNVFAYFLHDDFPTYTEGKTIRDKLDEAIYRLKNNYEFSLNIQIIKENDLWRPSKDINNCSNYIADAQNYVGKTLGLMGNKWNGTPAYDLYKKHWTPTKSGHGGYDVLIFATHHPADHLGMACYSGDWAFVSGGRSDLLNYKIPYESFDNIFQHEISHMFGALDRLGSKTIMDTELIFNGEIFTSPCLQKTTYLESDLDELIAHQYRYDGNENPMSNHTINAGSSFGYNQDYIWMKPLFFQSKNYTEFNSSYMLIQKVGIIGNNERTLYARELSNGLWGYFKKISNDGSNVSEPAMVIDNNKTAHVVWVDHTQGSETYGSIFYTYKEEGTYWSSPQILLNDSIYYNPILVTNSRNKICLIYGEEHKNNNYQFNFIEKLPGK